MSFTVDKTLGLYPYIDRLFESAFVFNANQLLLDGGKANAIKKFLGDLDCDSVVDIGCGPGNWARIAGNRYVGVDTSESFIRTARRKYRNDPTKRFLLEDATQITTNEPYDLAMLISVMHHLSEDEVRGVCNWAASNATRFFVLDLYPNPVNPVSNFLYAMDRGNFIREPDEQESLLTGNHLFKLIKKGDYFSPTRLYRHTLFLLESTAPNHPSSS